MFDRHSDFAMSDEPRRSRRLRGLAPEEPTLEQVCFICQGVILIDNLTRCQRTSCCGVLMHCRCHRGMVTRLRTCGSCRYVNNEFVEEIVLEKDEELEPDDDPFEIGTTFNARVIQELSEYRDG